MRRTIECRDPNKGERSFDAAGLRRLSNPSPCHAVFTLAAALAAGCAVTPAARDGIPAEPTIAQVREDLTAGRYSVRSLERHYEARIAAVDGSGPALHAVIEVNPDAAALAATLDAHGADRGPLFGVPVLLKDNIDTADRMQTTAGSLALASSRPAHDAFIVRRLRASGALILGKTNLSEWANFRSTHSTSGWSGRGGQTKNPYALDRNPCGSSAGSAAAVAADLAVVAVGTETDGSIVCPASVNGLVGIKPTVGLVSRSGIIPISVSQDTAGPMARSVADAAALLTVLAGYDPDDPATAVLKERAPPDYTQFLDRSSLQGARVGVLRQYAGFHPEVDAAFARALDALRAQGAVIVDSAAIAAESTLEADEQTVLLYEFKDGINRYLAGRAGSGPRTLEELIAFDVRESGREMPFFGQELFMNAQATVSLSDKAYIEAHERARRLAGMEGIDAALAKDQRDVLVAPTMGAAWTNDLVNGDHTLGGAISTAPAVAGYPHITVPMGSVHGLPVGVSFVGPAWSEPKLIAYAYAFEQATHAREPPRFAGAVP
ncbi:MAG TPA: amidase [Steroidobacteraceae bacterium]|jgi:amidase|nr:amidase [Steroidobacteraceae bacterium]